jgi:integrase
VRDVEPAEVARIVRAFRDQTAKSTLKATLGGRTAARMLLGAFKGLFGYAVANGWISSSPAAQITYKVIGEGSKARDRVLTEDEIKVVMTTDAAQGPVLRFLLATGLRISEAYNGHREGQYWVVPPSASKNKLEHRVWLSPIALAQLESHPWTAKWTVQRWITVNAGGWTAHDLRRTFSTRNNDMGVAPYVVEKMLNHTFDGVMAVYNRATYYPERRDALEKWSDALAAFGSVKFVPLPATDLAAAEGARP